MIFRGSLAHNAVQSFVFIAAQRYAFLLFSVNGLIYECKQWHQNISCKENMKQLRKLDKKTEKWRRKHEVKICPRCRIGIEKIDGCNHISCSNCSFQFCWVCQKEYTVCFLSSLIILVQVLTLCRTIILSEVVAKVFAIPLILC